MTRDIAIVGVGLHPFGRHEGVSGLAMGAHAARAALADAGLDWSDVQFAYGGSEDAGNADTMVAELGPTGLPFVERQERLRDRRLGARLGRPRARSPARTTSASSSASTSTRAARSRTTPPTGRCPPGTARTG